MKLTRNSRTECPGPSEEVLLGEFTAQTRFSGRALHVGGGSRFESVVCLPEFRHRVPRSEGWGTLAAGRAPVTGVALSRISSRSRQSALLCVPSQAWTFRHRERCTIYFGAQQLWLAGSAEMRGIDFPIVK